MSLLPGLRSLLFAKLEIVCSHCLNRPITKRVRINVAQSRSVVGQFKQCETTISNPAHNKISSRRQMGIGSSDTHHLIQMNKSYELT